MTDLPPEEEFIEFVASKLEDDETVEEVHIEPELPESGRIPDIRFVSGVVIGVVEVENDMNLGSLGQALVYAAHRPNYTPFVAVPARVVEEPEWTYINQHAVGLTFPYPEDDE